MQPWFAKDKRTTENYEQDAFPKEVLKAIGPGLITGASDDDPSGIATYSLAGAQFGFSMLWVAPVILPLVSCVEFICAKIAMVRGTGLAGVIREYYPRPVLFFSVSLLVIANTINVGTDIGAIASSINLLVPELPVLWMVPVIALVALTIEFFGSYKTVSTVFKLLTLSLLSYFFCTFFVSVDVLQLLRQTLIPELVFDSAHLTMLVALLGTTISPYCLFWQASEEVEEEMKLGRKDLAQRLGATDSELRAASIDVDFGMFVSVLVMYFIMVTTGATLHAAGKLNIESASNAAAALRPLAGDAAEILFALGIIGTGFLAISVLSDSSAYAISEALGIEPSLDEPPQQDKLFYGVIALSTVIGMAINFAGINPFYALYVTAVINGILAPVLLFFIMNIANDKRILGNRVNGLLSNFLGWTTALLMTVAAVMMFF